MSGRTPLQTPSRSHFTNTLIQQNKKNLQACQKFMGRHLTIAIIRLQNFNTIWWWISSALQSLPALVWQHIFSLALCFKHLQFILNYQSRMLKSASTEDYGNTVRSWYIVLLNCSDGWHTYYCHHLWPHRSGTASRPNKPTAYTQYSFSPVSTK